LERHRPAGPRGWGFLTVYIVAPILGAVLAGGGYQHFVAPLHPPVEPEGTNLP
jgi:glycerol uptake facilitator-like aquaporin